MEAGFSTQRRRLDNEMRRVGAVAADTEIAGRAEYLASRPIQADRR